MFFKRIFADVCGLFTDVCEMLRLFYVLFAEFCEHFCFDWSLLRLVASRSKNPPDSANRKGRVGGGALTKIHTTGLPHSQFTAFSSFLLEIGMLSNIE